MNVKLRESSGLLLRAESTSTTGPLKIRIRIIEGGVQGSSGYYPADVIERDGPKAFPKGTHMHLDHMSFWDMMEGSPGKLETLAGFIDSTPVYETVDGVPGLYADAVVISKHADFIREVGSNIGVSIMAACSADEGISPKTGEVTNIITGIEGSLSVDFVTHPGANGRITQVIESAKNHWSEGYQFVSTHPGIESGITKEGKPVAELSEAAVTALEGLPALLAAMNTKLDAAVEAAKPVEPVEGEGKIDLVETALSMGAALAESGLPKAAHSKVLAVARGNGGDLAAAIEAEKTYIASITAAVEGARGGTAVRQFGELHVVEAANAADDSYEADQKMAREYGRKTGIVKTGKAG